MHTQVQIVIQISAKPELFDKFLMCVILKYAELSGCLSKNEEYELILAKGLERSYILYTMVLVWWLSISVLIKTVHSSSF